MTNVCSKEQEIQWNVDTPCSFSILVSVKRCLSAGILQLKLTVCFSGNLTVEKFPRLFWGSNPSENRLILLVLVPQIHNLMSIQFSQRLLTEKLGPFFRVFTMWFHVMISCKLLYEKLIGNGCS